MAKIEAQTVIARSVCPDCGGRVFVKVNKNSNAYFNCSAEMETGNACAGQRRYGRDCSQTMQKLYIENDREPYDMAGKPLERPPVKSVKPVVGDEMGDFLNGI